MITERNCQDFLEILASVAPIPGGGGASAWVGAMGVALGSMVGNLIEIMQKALEAMDLHEELAVKGTRIAVSDVGVGVLFCKSALLGASLNVFINTKLMKDKKYAEAMNAKTEAMLAEGTAKADRIYQEVEVALK